MAKSDEKEEEKILLKWRVSKLSNKNGREEKKKSRSFQDSKTLQPRSR